jgi:glycosyltransferase involved in cell wall biosynthesis
LKIFIWTRVLDHLQLHTWSAVQTLLDQPITYVVTEPENRGRKQQGWDDVDLSALGVIYMKGRGWWRQSTGILNRHPDAVHVFWGFWSERRLFPLIVYAANRGIKTVVLNEHYSMSPVGYLSEENQFVAGVKVLLRPLLYRAAASLLRSASRLKKHPCVFPLSPQAYEQYVRAGFDKDALFPFGYFVPRMNASIHEPGQSGPFRLVFVAALLKRKGLDLAVQALKRLNERGIQVALDVYGSGDPSAFIPQGSVSVTYKGIIPTEQAQSVIAQYDALILPSRHDGWGVVVNESLLQGIPVIVSDSVGAKCLIESGGAGLVFKNEDVRDLSEKIRMLAEDSSLLQKLQINARKIGDEIRPEAGARYFLDALLFYFHGIGSRPSAVWSGDYDGG